MNFRSFFWGCLFLSVLIVPPDWAIGAPENLSGLVPAGSQVTPVVSNSFYFDLGSVSAANSTDYFSYSTGYHFGLGHEFGISPGFSIVLDLHYVFYDVAQFSNGLITGGELGTFISTVDVKFYFDEPTKPVIFYTIMGFGPAFVTRDTGVYTRDASSPILYPGKSETDLALRFGMGFDMKVDHRLAFFLEGDLTDVFTSPDLYAGSTSRAMSYGTLDQFRLSAGLKIKY